MGQGPGEFIVAGVSKQIDVVVSKEIDALVLQHTYFKMRVYFS